MDKKILMIEDEGKLARFVELELKHEGYSIDIAGDGLTGLTMFENNPYDLVLLDVMLPEMSGMEVLRHIRRVSDIPVIMLTAKAEVIDKVVGLDSGADDYITKPFAIEEVLARMRLAFKKACAARQDVKQGGGSTLRAGDLLLDLQARTTTVNGAEIELTKTEFDLLAYLVQNKNIVLSRDQILDQVWGYNYIGETNIVDVYIRYLRSKIDDRVGKKYIHTARGVGYCVKVAV